VCGLRRGLEVGGFYGDGVCLLFVVCSVMLCCSLVLLLALSVVYCRDCVAITRWLPP
jgi:hypothetical protein